jgi:DNA replication regulator DPB11
VSILRDHILSNAGHLLDAVADPPTAFDGKRLFLVVPYSLPSSKFPSIQHLDPLPDIVTDLWVERCLHSKQYHKPDEHALSQPLPRFPISGFEKHIVNSTGLSSIDLHHMSKAVNLIGAHYDEVLKPGTTVLICNPSRPGSDKLLHARRWNIPIVSMDWFWSCARSGKLQDFGAFLLNHDQDTAAADFPSAGKSVPDKQREWRDRLDRSAEKRKQETLMRSAATSDRDESPQRPHHDDSELGPDLRSREFSGNPSQKSGKFSCATDSRLFRGLKDSKSSSDRDEERPPTSATKMSHVPQADLVNGAIQELLGKSSRRNSRSTVSNGESRQKRLLGRALSNLSRSSREGSTTVRASRAGSSDSVRTDGAGSGQLDEPLSNRKHHGASLELGDAALYREEYPQEGEEPPQQSQLGYENPEDAVALRELLAERRRNRTRVGQEDEVQSTKGKEERRIKDEVATTKPATDSVVGRRTRQSAKLT